MSPENFCYWLQGYFELQLKVGGDAHNVLSSLQVQQIRDHLQLVFKKETPSLFPTDETVFQRSHGEKAAEDIFCSNVVYKHTASC